MQNITTAFYTLKCIAFCSKWSYLHNEMSATNAHYQVARREQGLELPSQNDCGPFQEIGKEVSFLSLNVICFFISVVSKYSVA